MSGLTCGIMNDTLARTAEYYSARLREHGPTPRGVDWNSAAAQFTRFEQLAKVCERDRAITVLDYGCGYGALLPFLRKNGFRGKYQGFDVSADMIKTAQNNYARGRRCTFTAVRRALRRADYVLASGIFNVNVSSSEASWRRHIHKVLDDIDHLAQKGFAFNMITAHVDYKQKGIYYADPCYYFTLCKGKYSRNVALLHDYGLYDFTILVRK